MEGAELEFRDDGLARRRARAMDRKTGARGLRTILEQVLLDTMYQLPSLKNVSKVVVDESVIVGHARPYIVYRSDDARTNGRPTPSWSRNRAAPPGPTTER